MTNPLLEAIRNIEEREELTAPMPCALCWNEPAIQGALGADCIFKNKIKMTEGE